MSDFLYLYRGGNSGQSPGTKAAAHAEVDDLAGRSWAKKATLKDHGPAARGGGKWWRASKGP